MVAAPDDRNGYRRKSRAPHVSYLMIATREALPAGATTDGRGVSGDLTVLGLGTLLQAIGQQGGWGTLTVRRVEEHKTLFIDGRNLFLTEVSHPAATRLGQILLRSGRLLPDRLREVLETMPSGHPRIGELLMAHGAITPADLEQALADQAMEEICDLFAWTEATFEFAERRPASVGPALPIPIAAVVLEAARRRDEQRRARRLIPSRDLVPVPMRLNLPEDDPALDVQIVRSLGAVLDGRRSVAELLARCPYSEFAVESALAGLVERGVVKLIDAREGRPIRAPAKVAPEPAAVPPSAVVVTSLRQFGAALCAALQEAGIRAHATVIEENLRQLLETLRPKIVILDPVEFISDLDRVRPLAAAIDASIVLLISNPSRDAILRAGRAGARDVLIKPIATDLLIRRLNKIAEAAA
jgi:CheY-like chemotaxis protein